MHGSRSHYTLDRAQKGRDHGFALEPDELAEMVQVVREAEVSLGSGFKRVTEQDITVKRHGFGIPVHELDIVLGHTVNRTVEAYEILTWDDLR